MLTAILPGTASAQSDQAYATPAVNEILTEQTPAAGYWLPTGTRVEVVSRHVVIFHLPGGKHLTRYDGEPVSGFFTRLRLEGSCNTTGDNRCYVYRLNGEYTILTGGCTGGCKTIVTPLE